MKMQEVRIIAKRMGVDARIGRSKQEVIREIQIREGFEPCFKTRSVCDEHGCLWREDCLKTK